MRVGFTHKFNPTNLATPRLLPLSNPGDHTPMRLLRSTRPSPPGRRGGAAKRNKTVREETAMIDAYDSSA
jgi:hypothetical protein